MDEIKVRRLFMKRKILSLLLCAAMVTTILGGCAAGNQTTLLRKVPIPHNQHKPKIPLRNRKKLLSKQQLLMT